MTGFYSFYNAGRFDGESEDRIMFSCYAPDRRPGQSTLVLASESAKHRSALIELGYERLPE